jgi:hypothetical protein
MRRSQALLLAATAILVFATAARAEDAPVPITDTDLTTAGSWGPLLNKTVELTNCKFRDYFDPYVRLAKLPTDRLRLDASAHAALVNDLSGFRTATGPLDRKSRSNVRVVGIARDDSVGRVIEVTDVTLTADDVDVYRKRLEALGAGDSDGRMKLADEARKRSEQYSEDDLRDWSRAAYESALDAKRAALAKGDVDGAIDLALKYRDLAQVPSKGISLLSDIVLDAAADPAAKEKGMRVLEKDLQAVLHRDHWISREDFKAALGYLLRHDAAGNVVWVRRERVEFEQEVKAQRDANKNDPNLRKLLGSEYETAAGSGQPTIGMYKQELVRTKGYGFPDLVDRFTEKSPGNGDLVWDQWIMGDGSRFYFMNGILFSWKKKDVPFPKN